MKRLHREMCQVELRELKKFAKMLTELLKAYASLELTNLFDGSIIDGLYNTRNGDVVLDQFKTLAENEIKKQIILIKKEKEAVKEKYYSYYAKYLYNAVAGCGGASHMKLTSKPSNVFIIDFNKLEVTLSEEAIKEELVNICSFEMSEVQQDFANEINNVQNALTELREKFPNNCQRFNGALELVKNYSDSENKADIDKIMFQGFARED